MKQEATVINSGDFAVLTGLAKLRKKNRVPSEGLVKALDPQGVHVMEGSMIHNDVEMRTWWLVKVEGSDKPMGPVFLDMDFEDYRGLTKIEVDV